MKHQDRYKRPNLNQVKLIPLTQNQFTLVDTDRYDYLNQWKWHAVKCGNGWYAMRKIGKGKDRRYISLAEVIKPKNNNQVTNHINNNSLDNRKCNLESVSQRRNLELQRINNCNHFSSHYKGVSHSHFRHKTQKWVWQAYIKKEYLGLFDSEIEAAKAYDKKALEVFGERAYINFPIEPK